MTCNEPPTGPVQVFIMLGQSNMLGFGTVGDPETPGTLEYLMEKQGKYPHLKDADGKWVQSKNVRYVQNMCKQGKMNILSNEWLSINPHRKFGPELGMSQVLGPYMEETNQPAMLLKSCIGNRSLGWDLLPPGSSSFEHDGKIYAGYKDSPSSWDKGTTAERIGWYGGKQYDDDTGRCKDILADIGSYYPGATEYKVAGFIWWQGHKDQNDAHAGKYEENLVRLIESLRKDFEAPKAKFVCATVAFDGFSMKGHLMTIHKAQLAVSGDGWRYHGTRWKYPQFRGNVMTIDARPYWRGKEDSPKDQGHHYNHNTETYYEVGYCLGEALVGLLKNGTSRHAKDA